MRALVVYESLWGNTAAVANAIAEGIGGGAHAVSTAQANTFVHDGVELLVCGAPVFAFHLSGPRIREQLRETPQDAPAPADLSHPSMRDWIAQMPHTSAVAATFDTRVRGPFGTGAPAIAKLLTTQGIRAIGKPRGFIVTGKYGPLADDALDDARRWGAELAALAAATQP